MHRDAWSVGQGYPLSHNLCRGNIPCITDIYTYTHIGVVEANQ